MEELKIKGNLDIFVAEYEEIEESVTVKWNEIMIHGDPEGLKSLAQQLIYLAELDQEGISDKVLPTGARKHIHLKPKYQLSNSSNETIIGRLDSKGKKEFYSRFEVRTHSSI